ncbi:hypothetical protein CP533_1848 [Ophiocordyceps camponoti-saundersi (nom. inval.)]|nr:hypothetical protein CP533_1848 [Ophiocordyceps camponoti-saundersi (nom. inval.)]
MAVTHNNQASHVGDTTDSASLVSSAVPHRLPATDSEKPDSLDDETSQSSPGAEPSTLSKPLTRDETEENYKPKTFKFWLIVLSAFVSMFLVALDRTILSTAIPRITDDFRSLGDIGWYGSAYMLTTAAFQLLFGRIYKFYDLRVTFLWCIVVFEVGSAICGAAPTSPIFILGRAIAGLGSAGITTGTMMIIIPMVPLHKRPMFQSLFGVIFGISSVAGPLIGGAFTERVTWRWCFYMNLPVGVVAFIFLFFFLKIRTEPREPAPAKQHIMRLDPLGTFFFLPSIVCLVLALQWGGSTYPWGSWRIVLLFVFFVLTAGAFTAVQILMPKTATIPARVITQRTTLAATFFMFFLSGGMLMLVYYIPLWFQTTHGINPVESGIYTIPLILSLVIAAALSAAFTQRIGYFAPSMILSPCVTAIGDGLMTTFTPTTGSPHWIAYQFLVGFGIGLGMQTSMISVQATLPKMDVPMGIAIVLFAQQLGGAIFVSVGQTILSGALVQKLSHVPGLDPQAIVRAGATELRRMLPARYLPTVLDAYNFACTRIFYAALALAFAQLLTAAHRSKASLTGSSAAGICICIMSVPAYNPLMSSQRSSQLQALLHPLVLLGISDYITRHSLRNQQGPIVGALLGQQNGREITIEHVFDCHICAAPEVEGGWLLENDPFAARLEQSKYWDNRSMTTVHKERQLELVGWYTLFPASGPTPAVVPIHNQILRGWNESAVLLGFHPEEALKNSVGGKLPLTIYESNYEVDEATNNTNAGDGDEDRRMDDGEAAALKLRFREVPYSVETDETEMISMNYVADGGGGNASASITPAVKEERPARSVESNGKGKRRLIESELVKAAEAEAAAANEDHYDSDDDDNDEDDELFTLTEEKTLASLTAKANAIKMLNARLRLMVSYLQRLPPSFVNGEATAAADDMDTDSTTPSLPILRQIQALVARVDLVVPSDADAFDREAVRQENDTLLIQLLHKVVVSSRLAREVGKKFAIVDSSKTALPRRGAAEAMPSNSSFSMSSTGDIFI